MGSKKPSAESVAHVLPREMERTYIPGFAFSISFLIAPMLNGRSLQSPMPCQITTGRKLSLEVMAGIAIAKQTHAATMSRRNIAMDVGCEFRVVEVE
jgi:hypothetical protein